MSLRKNTICGLSLLLAVSLNGLEVKAITVGKTVSNVAVMANKATLPTGGAIDLPAQGEKVSMGSIKVAGWALSQNGVKEIKVYLDNKYVGNATLGNVRGDIGNAFPQYPNSMNSGYSYDLSTLNLSKGNHVVKVEILGNLGEVAVAEKNFSYVGLEGLTCIDTPANGSAIGGSKVVVSGWALNPSGIKKVNILVDGVLKGEAQIGQERLDVDKVFPGYQGGKNSGYSYELDLSGISKGTHVITAQGVGNDGTFKNWDMAVKVDKLENLVCLDKPIVGTTVESDRITVSGWALNNSGTKDIRILIDGVERATGVVGIQRLDVDKVFPGYPGGKNSGYSIDVDATKLNDGTHIITVRATGNDGSLSEVATAIKLKKPAVVPPTPPIVDPSMNITYKDYSNTLDYYVDRQFTGTLNVVWPGGVATKDEIKTYMNPELYVNDPVAKYIFLKLNYINGIDVSDLNSALINGGVLTNKGQAFLDGGLKYNVNPIYLVSHAIHETGRGTSTLAKGILVTSVDGQPVMPKVVYNMYGVGAIDSDPDRKGSEYAYKQGWFTVDDAIIGGAQFISKNYINNAVNKQDTLYKMKWDLDRIWHAYATDIGWANKTAPNIKKIIDKMKNPPLQFEVPKFKK